MEITVTQKQMLDYLEMFLTAWLEDKEKYGMEDNTVKKDMDRLLGCKCMVETLIGQPVSLMMNGTVAVGF